MRIYKQVFEQHLRFRGKTEHAQCDICQRLKRRISEADSRVQREELTKQYSRHILSQWLDRQVYWKLRALSQSYFSSLGAKVDAQIHSSIYSSVLTAILDGMDQSKLRCPKFGFERVSKSIAKLHRPALHLAGLWLHGYKLFLPITDENTKKNSETQIEYLMRGLSQLVTEQSTLPLGLHLQQPGRMDYTKSIETCWPCYWCWRSWFDVGVWRWRHALGSTFCIAKLNEKKQLATFRDTWCIMMYNSFDKLKVGKGCTALIRTEAGCASSPEEVEIFQESDMEELMTPPRRLTLGLL